MTQVEGTTCLRLYAALRRIDGPDGNLYRVIPVPSKQVPGRASPL